MLERATRLGIGDETRLVLLGAGVGGDRRPFALSLIIMISEEGEDFLLVDWSTFAKKELNDPSSAILMDSMRGYYCVRMVLGWDIMAWASLDFFR